MSNNYQAVKYNTDGSTGDGYDSHVDVYQLEQAILDSYYDDDDDLVSLEKYCEYMHNGVQ